MATKMDYRKIIAGIENDLKEFPKKVMRATEVLTGDLDHQVATTPADVVYTEDKMKLLHYRSLANKKKIHATPVLIVYALINRYIMITQPGA